MGIAKYQINEDFFNDSEEYWYFVGLVASDGYISDNVIEICLNKKDEHILIKLRDLICPNKPIYDEPSTHSKKFTIHSKNKAKMMKDLFSMDSNKKHLEIKIPSIPDGYFKDFVRGIIDGDGCIDTTKAYRNDKVYTGPRLRILGNRVFLIELIEKINYFIPNGTKAVSKKGAENVWYITYNFSVAKNILKWCYEENKICFFRKYNKFKEVSDMKK